jgi:hypothetical protein
MNDPEGYWEKWQKLIEAAAEFRPPFDSWDVISSVCKKVATGLTLSLSSEQG